MPWQYPTRGLAAANARNTRSKAARCAGLSSCACPGNVRGTSLRICSEVCLGREARVPARSESIADESAEDVSEEVASSLASTPSPSPSTEATSDGYAPGTRTSSTRRQSCQISPRSAMGTPPRTSDSSSRSRRGASAEHAPRSRFRRISSTASSPVPLVEGPAGAPRPRASRASPLALAAAAYPAATGDVGSEARSRNAIHRSRRSSSSFTNIGTCARYASANAGLTTNP